MAAGLHRRVPCLSLALRHSACLLPEDSQLATPIRSSARNVCGGWCCDVVGALNRFRGARGKLDCWCSGQSTLLYRQRGRRLSALSKHWFQQPTAVGQVSPRRFDWFPEERFSRAGLSAFRPEIWKMAARTLQGIMMITQQRSLF